MGIGRFALHEGRADDFERLSRQCMEIVREKDTGTLRYDIYLNADRTEAIVIEQYTDARALQEHLANIGPELMAAIAGTGELSGEVLGDLPSDLAAQLEDAPVRTFAPFLALKTGT
jgi:quinol monooxygenase YgiN